MNEDNPFVCVIDDESSIRESLSSLLRSAGLKVQAFASAQEFLANWPREAPSCLVLDIQLPAISGLDLQQELADGDAQIPIIFMRNKPLIRVNCTSIPRELFESEFFGHAKGAFTGAIKDRTGRFEAAAGGTLFLDEAGEIPSELQSKLLRVLQEKSYERVGEDKTRRAETCQINPRHCPNRVTMVWEPNLLADEVAQVGIEPVRISRSMRRSPLRAFSRA